MTFKNRTIILGSVAAALLLAFILGKLLSPLRMGAVSSEAALLRGFRADAVGVINLSGQGSSVRLVRSGGWTMDISGVQYPASASKIDYLLQELSKLPRGKLVTRSAAEAASLGVEGPDAVSITAASAAGAELCALSVGKTPAVGRGRYVRVGSSPEIWETAVTLSPYATAERTFWEDLRVLPRDLASKDIVRMAVTGRLALSDGKTVNLSYTLTLTKNPTGGESWSLSKGPVGSTPQSAPGAAAVQADTAKVNSLIETVLSMEGADFDTAANAAASTAANAAARIELGSSEGKTYAVLIGSRVEGDQYPCTAAGGTFAYLVPAWRVTQALAAPETLTAQK